MYLGRIGPHTLGLALALRERQRPYPVRRRTADHWLERSEFLVCGLGGSAARLATELDEARPRGARRRCRPEGGAGVTRASSRTSSRPTPPIRRALQRARRRRLPDCDRRDRNRHRGEHPDDLGARRPRRSAGSSRRRSRRRTARSSQRVGAHRVVFPERDMGVRVAHTVTGRTIDYIQLDPGFALVETTAPTRDRREDARRGGGAPSLRDHGGLRQARRTARFTYATPDTVVKEGDILVVAGETTPRGGIQRASLSRVGLALGRVGDDPDVDPGECSHESHDQRAAQDLLRSAGRRAFR